MTTTVTGRVRRRVVREARRAESIADLGLSAVGVRRREQRLAEIAQDYWTDDAAGSWRDQSHWRGGDIIDNERFLRLGREHAALFDRMAATVGGRDRLGRVVEWGAGGGANAVAFAPRADEFVVVDVAAASLPECARQVAAVCDTPVTPVLARVGDPEAAFAVLPGPCDLFLCLYVLELVPSPEYGLRLMRLAAEALREGGLAFVQIKYDDGSLFSQSRRRGYRRDPAAMTTYQVERFWVAMQELDLVPEVVSLVPRSGLGERYAYFLLRRAGE